MSGKTSMLSKISVPIGYSDSTGLNVYESYASASGFNYFIGARNAGDILIIEKVAEGVACTYLCGVLIFNRVTKTLLKEIEVPKQESYTRDKVFHLVRTNLLDILLTSSKKEEIEIDEDAAIDYIDQILDRCYFEQSRKSIIEWAKNVGIIKLN